MQYYQYGSNPVEITIEIRLTNYVQFTLQGDTVVVFYMGFNMVDMIELQLRVNSLLRHKKLNLLLRCVQQASNIEELIQLLPDEGDHYGGF